jgi:chorismate--pyruvate lyase
MTNNTDSLLDIGKLPPSSLSSWLSSNNSLTNKLKAITGHTRLQVLEQKWVFPDWWDKHVLKIALEAVFHREIVMWSHHHACWFARTIIPYQSYQTDAPFFNRLEKETLNELIYNNPHVKRTSYINYSINQQSLEYHWLGENLHQNADCLWVRLSTFTLHNANHFYLVEIFLPGLIESQTEIK